MLRKIREWIEASGENSKSRKALLQRELVVAAKTFKDILPENISHLIRQDSGRYIVFLDCEEDLDWETSDAFEAEYGHDRSARDAIISEVTLKNCIPTVHYLSKKMKRDFSCMLGEVIVLALTGEFETARKHLLLAEQYLEKRKFEISRKWRLLSSFSIWFAITVVFCLINIHSSSFAGILNIRPETIRFFLYMYFGTIGTLLSIIQNNGKHKIDCEAGPALMFIDCCAKMAVGLISGFFILCLFELDLVFTNFKNTANPALSLALVSTMAGFSERLVPSIVSKFEIDSKKEKETSDTESAETPEGA